MHLVSRIRQRVEHIRAVASELTSSESQARLVRRAGYRLLVADQLGLAGREHELALSKDSRAFSVSVRSVADFSLLYDLMIKEEYVRVKEIGRVLKILDFGSNIGVSAIYFHLAFPEASITCFEPDHSNVQQLRRNIERLPVSVRVEHAAVGGADGEVAFYENTRRGVSSSLMRRTSGQKETRVRMRGFDTVLAEHGPVDLLKFDIEGAEYDLFRNAKNISAVAHYAGELHPDLMGCSIETFCALFHGYTVHVEPYSPSRYGFFASRVVSPL